MWNWFLKRVEDGQAQKGQRFPVIAGGAVAFLVALLSLAMPNRYRSDGTILPAETKTPAGVGSLATAAAALGFGLPGADGGDANVGEILNSRPVKEAILNTTYTFREKSWYFGSAQERRQTLYAYYRAKNMDRAIKALGRDFGASRELKTKITSVSMTSRSPELSQQVVARSIHLLEWFIKNRSQTRGGNKAVFATARLDESRQELAKAADDLRRFLDGNRNFTVSADPGVRIRGAMLEAEFKLKQQMVATLAVNREQALLEEKNDLPILNILDGGNLPIDKSGPSRLAYVVLAFLATTAGCWLWFHRAWLRALLVEGMGEGTAE